MHGTRSGIKGVALHIPEDLAMFNGQHRRVAKTVLFPPFSDPRRERDRLVPHAMPQQEIANSGVVAIGNALFVTVVAILRETVSEIFFGFHLKLKITIRAGGRAIDYRNLPSVLGPSEEDLALQSGLESKSK